MRTQSRLVSLSELFDLAITRQVHRLHVLLPMSGSFDMTGAARQL
jgi:hypothetical protein